MIPTAFFPKVAECTEQRRHAMMFVCQRLVWEWGGIVLEKGWEIIWSPPKKQHEGWTISFLPNLTNQGWCRAFTKSVQRERSLLKSKVTSKYIFLWKEEIKECGSKGWEVRKVGGDMDGRQAVRSFVFFSVLYHFGSFWSLQVGVYLIHACSFNSLQGKECSWSTVNLDSKGPWELAHQTWCQQKWSRLFWFGLIWTPILSWS